MSDDWKGEDLIRSVKKVIYAGHNNKGNGRLLPPCKTKCLVPGCETIIRAAGTAGVCFTHLHNFSYCQCVRCKKRRKVADLNR